MLRNKRQENVKWTRYEDTTVAEERQRDGEAWQKIVITKHIWRKFEKKEDKIKTEMMK